MAIKKNSTSHFIDDGGVYLSNKPRHSAIFVTFCRLLTVALMILGVVALIVGNM